jgi:nucleotide-binding universal stress UspA family protein
MANLTSIAVHVDHTNQCPERLAVAATLARQHGAQLTGVYVAPPVWVPPYVGLEVTPAVIEIFESQRMDAQAKAEAHFAALRRIMPDAVWRAAGRPGNSFGDDIVSMLVSEAHLFDLMVVGQTGPGEDGSSAPGVVPEALVMQTGRPTLVVPYAGRFHSVATRAIVAWSDTRESVRALADALPLLAKSKSTTILQVVDGEIDDRRRAALAAVATYLERHSIKAKSELIPLTDDVTAADLVLSRAADMDADLLVMGGYGHSRFRELVLGGFTREILSSMPLPVLLSH